MSYIKRFFSIIKKAISEYNRNKLRHKYKIQHIDEETNTFTIQIVGKNSVFKSHPNNLVNDFNVIKDFIYDEAKVIFLHYFRENTSYEIVKLIIDENTGRPCFLVRKKGKRKATPMLPEAITKNKDLLYSFSKKDVDRISREVGKIDKEKEIEEIKRFKINKDQ